MQRPTCAIIARQFTYARLFCIPETAGYVDNNFAINQYANAPGGGPFSLVAGW